MKTYAVFKPNPKGLTVLQIADRTRFIQQGFCWAAFLLGFVWLIYRKQWFGLVIYLAGVVLFSYLGATLNVSESLQSLIALILQLWLGIEARNLQMLKLEGQGYTRVDTVFASKVEMAEYSYFSHSPIEAAV